MAALTKAVGLDDRFTPDTREEVLAIGDRYLILTDGVWREMTDARLLALASTGTGTTTGTGTAEDVARNLVTTALAAGGTDNATAVVIGRPNPAAGRG
ncbi:MAG: hypothetical protein FD149_1279 [Rhodospirillaceae bacterium]|nr:MAG: hypothetical protein FD149_1279 [Rhodospirillaceae bacterium]